MLRYPSGSSSVSCVRLRNGQELVCLSWMTGSMGGRGSRSSGSSSSSSSMRLQMFGTNLLQWAEWQGYTAFLLRELAEQDGLWSALLCQDSRCSLLQACPSRRVLPWLCPARLAGYFWFFVRPLRNPDMGHSQGGQAKAKDTPWCLCCQGQSFGRKEFSNWEGEI